MIVKRRLSKVMSIFGPDATKVAEEMLAEGKGSKVTTDHFPDRALSPEVWVDSQGREAVFAVHFTISEMVEFAERLEKADKEADAA